MARYADLSSVKRQLTIKTGVVKRLAKEESSYMHEAREQEVRIQQFIDAGRDEYDLKQQDSLKMIPDCRKRLELAVDDLAIYIDGVEGEAVSSDEYGAAKQVLESAQAQIQSPLPTL
ncbi:tubulin-specific chaperone A-like [Moesziomyces antarcticus]|uniref:Tubulin-specific chaperone A n=2 Tax=Pseudozyma antarctica TaxID=84753 RepID=A0A081CEB5_PSEA2|nr:tubulin-specific chaperone A-like [Moesziomyces antarcticus]GAK65011.1 tubulin-specific chaperone A-like [Moesziomyces antarcticus]SPO45999.1 related to Tubulin-specific chaperone A [Moesziomyces antarcticus]